MIKIIILSLMLCSLIAEETFMKEMPALIKEYRSIAKETEDVVGKLDDLIAKLKTTKPNEESEYFDSYLSALGELLMANGNYDEAATALRKTKAATENYDWGVWKKIIESVFKGSGKDAAQAEYDAVVQIIGEKPMGRDFIEMVGGHLNSLKEP